MKKITSIALAIALSMGLMAGVAFAHDGGDNNGDDNSGRSNFGARMSAFTHIFNHDKNDDVKRENENHQLAAVARVTAISNGDEITAEGLGKAERTFSIHTDSDTDFFLGNGSDADFNDIDVGDTIIFNGNITDKNDGEVALDASKIKILGDVDLAAKARVSGEIKEVNNSDDQLTITTDDNETITVNATDFTTIKDEDGDHVAFADLSEGMSVRIKGFWNSLHNLITAIKIRITS